MLSLYFYTSVHHDLYNQTSIIILFNEYFVYIRIFFQEISAVKRPNVLRINKIHALFKNNRRILSPFITSKSRKNLYSSSIQTRQFLVLTFVHVHENQLLYDSNIISNSRFRPLSLQRERERECFTSLPIYDNEMYSKITQKPFFKHVTKILSDHIKS